MGWTRLKCMGWAKPGPTTGVPCEQWPPLFTCYVNCEGMAGTKQERKKGRRVDLRWLQPLAVLLEATGGGAGGSRWPTVLFFFSLSSVFRSLLRFFSSSFGLPLLFSLLSLLFSALSFLFPPHFSRALPVFIGKTGEIEARGGHYAIAPKIARGTHLPLLQHVESFGQVGLVDVFLRESWQWKTEEEKIFFFPCFARPGEEKRLQCRSKRHRFGLFFFLFFNSAWNGAVLGKTRRFI